MCIEAQHIPFVDLLPGSDKPVVGGGLLGSEEHHILLAPHRVEVAVDIARRCCGFGIEDKDRRLAGIESREGDILPVDREQIVLQAVLVVGNPVAETGGKVVVLFEAVAPAQILIPTEEGVGRMAVFTVGKIDRKVVGFGNLLDQREVDGHVPIDIDKGIERHVAVVVDTDYILALLQRGKVR